MVAICSLFILIQIFFLAAAIDDVEIIGAAVNRLKASATTSDQKHRRNNRQARVATSTSINVKDGETPTPPSSSINYEDAKKFSSELQKLKRERLVDHALIRRLMAQSNKLNENLQNFKKQREQDRETTERRFKSLENLCRTAKDLTDYIGQKSGFDWNRVQHDGTSDRSDFENLLLPLHAFAAIKRFPSKKLNESASISNDLSINVLNGLNPEALSRSKYDLVSETLKNKISGTEDSKLPSTTTNQFEESIRSEFAQITDKTAWYTFIVEHFNAELQIVKGEMYKMMKLIYNIDDALPTVALAEQRDEDGAPVVYAEERQKQTNNIKIDLQNTTYLANKTYILVQRLAERIHEMAQKQSNLEKVQHFDTSRSLTEYKQVLGNISIEIANISAFLDGFETRLQNYDELADRKIQVLKKNVHLNTIKISNILRVAEVIKKHQNSHFSAIQHLKQRTLDLDAQFRTFSAKVSRLQNEFLNASLFSYKETNRDLQQDVKLAGVYTEIDRLDLKMDGVQDSLKSVLLSLRKKAEHVDIKKITSDVTDLAEKVQAISTMSDGLRDVNHALNLLEHQLPNDCSYQGVPFDYIKYRTGEHVIYPRIAHSGPIKAHCQFESDDSSTSRPLIGWTVIQNRRIGNESFNKTWSEYENGFGDRDFDYWLGNKWLHAITSQRPYQLQIDVWDIFDEYRFALYDRFSISNSSEDYALNLGAYEQIRSNLSDSMAAYHNGARFSTPDRDNDASSTNCAKFYSSGWWFAHCLTANLNGRFDAGIIWFDNSTGDWRHLKRTAMKIRPNNG